MAIHVEQQNQMQGGGIVKQIDESGIAMVYDTLQKYQYSFPIKSTVREILCNAIDSVAEKKMAREILTGKAKVEDYFENLEGPLYKDSKWNPDYYNLKFLNDRDDKVYMTYVMGSQMAKDMVIFEDTGVGLWGKRLEGYFKLAFSTKRLSKIPIGKWGLGAKSPLSVGVDSYIMESWCNGRYYKFQIYSNTYYSIVPQFDLENGRENEFVIFNESDPDIRNHYKVYYAPTDRKNGVRITIEAKKHHKQQYIDAVKSQMLYFEGIEFKVQREDGTDEVIPYKAGILYEDDMIVMSDNNYYSKPHLLLNKVNYGYIDWNELELQDIQGNIGIKVQPEDVEVNPSRESVLWTEKTKEKVLKRFEEVVDIASKMIQEELKETDIVKWIKVCNSISGRWTGRNTIVGRLAEIVDLSKVKPKFSQNDKIAYDGNTPLRWIYNRQVRMEVDRKNGVTKKRVSREAWAPAINRPLILLKHGDKLSNRKDKYLLSLYEDGFNQMYEPYGTWEKMEQAHKSGEMLETIYNWYDHSFSKSDNKNPMSLELRRQMWEFVAQSSDVIWYSEVDVPESFTGTDEEEDVTEEAKTEEAAKKEEVARITAEERRKLEGKTIISTLQAIVGSQSVQDPHAPAGVLVKKYYNFTKFEVPIKSINDWDAQEIYYGFEADNELLHFAAMLTRDPHHANKLGSPRRSYAEDYNKWKESKYFRKNRDGQNLDVQTWDKFNMQHFYDAQVMLVKVAQNNARYYRDFQRIQEFFITINDNVITMSNTLIKWNTARIIKDKLGRLAFLYNFQSFNPAFAEMYESLCDYVNRHYREVKENSKDSYGVNEQTYNDLVTHLDNVRKFQDFVQKGRPAEEIAALANELFGNRELTDGMAVDPRMMRMLEDVINYYVAVGPMFNYIPYLTGYYDASLQAPAYTPTNHQVRSKKSIPEELEMEIRMLLEHKGVLDYKSAFEIEENERLAATIEGSSKGIAQVLEEVEQ